MTAGDFATIETFGDEVRTRGRDIAPLLKDSFQFLDDEVRSFYARRGREQFKDCKLLGGMGLVWEEAAGSSAVSSTL
jgi:hypothetical protein